MILVPCPHCGPRNAGEYRYVGESVARPDPATATPAEWNGYLYLKANRCGWQRETWYHRAGCRTYFTLERHTLTNEFRSPAGGAPDGDDAGLAPTVATPAETPAPGPA